MSPKPPNVAICIPCYDKPTAHTWVALTQLQTPRPGGPVPGSASVHRMFGLETAVARKQLTLRALEDPSVTHILWIDADMDFPPDALLRLLAHDKDIVGGLCHNRRGPSFQPVAAKRYPPELGLPDGMYGFVYDLPREGLFEVDATGAAFLLVKREVYDRITNEWADHENDADDAAWWRPIGDVSEDFSFCRRAQALDYKIWIDCGLDIGHVGEISITRDVATKLRTNEWAKWSPLMAKPADGKPLVTIVIPTYNQKPAYLKAAVLSALNQTVPTEVIVVDDGTTDYYLRCDTVIDHNTPMTHAQIVEHNAQMSNVGGDRRTIVWISSRAKLVKHPENRGISAALNTGIAHMTTDWFCWLSSDDLMEPNKVETQLNAMLAVGAKASFHDYAVIANDGSVFSKYAQGTTWRTQEAQNAQLREACCINGSTVMLHASVFDAFEEDAKMGRIFDPALRYAQDWDLWLKVGRHFLWHHVPKILGTRREGENLTAQLAASPENDPARQRRDEEDRIVRERYAPRLGVAYIVLNNDVSPDVTYDENGRADARLYRDRAKAENHAHEINGHVLEVVLR